ncbi:FMN-binding protein [Sulfurimonas paralvinellae]|uniref:FMN-binding protein n=1 Tax=Sulfurimonas paralvinellae TaxID=317658 RepID=A0A7M1B7W7_9BACT|nr:FMN-binding protein [Sulfurimonas paralvinellae]QOP45823.1 FMN-binding protein [Sulfurimonas paralvinellae]
MKYILLLSLLIFSLTDSLSAKVLVSPIDAMKENYSQTAVITKKNILLSGEQFKKIQSTAKAKLTTKIYRIYVAKEKGKTLGYGILINHKVRSKNAVVMYLITKGKLLGIEIIAFNEPHEYIPSKTWQEQFQNIPTDKMLHLSRDIPTITGATLSARSVTESSRIAFAIYNELLKGK